MTSLFTNPWGYAVEAMAADAVNFSKEKGIPGKHVNAITHAYVSAHILYISAINIQLQNTSIGAILSGRKISSATKEAYALEAGRRATFLGDLKESATHPFSDPNPRDTLKDQYNNEVGRRIASYAFKNNLDVYQVDSLLFEAYVKNVIAYDELDPRINGKVKWDVTADFAASALNRCFAAGTMILMADGSERPIELILANEIVASFDETADGGRGALVGKRVVRTFVNENQIVIDFHGTKVTPGHAYLCGDGPHQGRFRQIMNVIRDDGAVVLADGSLMRASTGCLVGSADDVMLEIQIIRPARNKLSGETVTLLKERGRVRAGTRLQRPDGSFFSFLDLIQVNGWSLRDDGLVSQGPHHSPEPLLWAGSAIPKPEDYILSLSQLTLADLYDDPRQAEMPDGNARPRQGEQNAVVPQAVFASNGDGGLGTSATPLGRRILERIGVKRKPDRMPRHAGDIVH